jgi:uncharacterized protein YbcI
MDKTETTMTEKLAEMATTFQLLQTGRAPSNVSVVIGDHTLVLTLHEALPPAEQSLATIPQGAADLHEFYRMLFRSSAASLQKEIERITGRRVREASAEIDPETGSVIHAFTTGTANQVFLLNCQLPAEAAAAELAGASRHSV